MNEFPALRRLIAIAKRDTGQSKLVANVLLAWHNAEENGAWDPTELWAVDAAIADDMLATLKLIRSVRQYPGDLLDCEVQRVGYGGSLKSEMEYIWSLWRKLPAFKLQDRVNEIERKRE